MSNFDPALVDYFKMGADGETIGLPFATYPSFMYYNKKLFDEAELPYPPTKVGDLYEGKPWDMEAVRQLGMKLTVDKNGNDATSADFDPTNVVQWGFDMQWADDRPTPRRPSSVRARSSADDGKTAQITDQFRTGLKWFNDGVWKDHFIPTYAQIQSDLLGKGNPFQSGNLAMAETHSWYMCCINPAPPASPSLRMGRRGRAVLQRHDDGEAPRRHIQHPRHHQEPGGGLPGGRGDGQSAELLVNYGAFPADPALQQAFFDTTRAVPGLEDRLDRAPGDARLRRQAEPPGLDARLPEVAGSAQGRVQQVSDH